MAFDVAIIGAGPAGMEAALLARQFTKNIIVLDARTEPGGNIYASIGSCAGNFPEHFRKFDLHYRTGLDLVEKFVESSIDYRPSTSVWHIGENGQVACRGTKGASVFRARRIILCTGAHERPLPIPGWTLPGVMGVGAAQIALKSSAVPAKQPTVIIGNGPLTLLYARQLRRLGGRIDTFIIPKTDRNPGSLKSGLRAAMIKPVDTANGLALMLDRTFSGARIIRDATNIEIIGRDRVEAVQFEKSGLRKEQAASSVLLHDGIVPDINISAGAGLQTDWSKEHQYWHPVLDSRGRSSQQNILVAGDAGGIAGARAAHFSGRLAAMTALFSLNLASDNDLASTAQETEPTLKRDKEFNSLLGNVYPTFTSSLTFPDNLTVCRCEGVRAGDLRREIASMEKTNIDPNRLKSALRIGMGPCQGRNCSLSVANIVAKELSTEIDNRFLVRTRAPYTQVTLGELADISSEEQEQSP